MATTWRARAIVHQRMGRALTSVFGSRSIASRNFLSTAGEEILYCNRRSLGTTAGKQRDDLQVCIVGSGPAGFYTADKVLKRFEGAKVDILDRLPTPFGLVRSEVAPDHPETKNVINKFSQVAVSDRCSYFGNVTLGADVSLEELRELYDVVVLAYGAESDRRLGVTGEDEMKVSRKHKRVYELFVKAAGLHPSTNHGTGGRELSFVFFRNPAEILSSSDGARVAGVKLEKTVLQGEKGNLQRAVGTGEFEDVSCGLVLKSIGYKSIPVLGLPFDHRQGLVPNSKGRVFSNMEQGSSVEAGLFVVGWLKRGPTGIIGDNVIDADDTVQSIDEDWRTGNLGAQSNSCPPGGQGLQALLQTRCTSIVTFDDWLMIHEAELKLGSLKGKPQEKIVTKDDMLVIARQVSSGTGR